MVFFDYGAARTETRRKLVACERKICKFAHELFVGRNPEFTFGSEHSALARCAAILSLTDLNWAAHECAVMHTAALKQC